MAADLAAGGHDVHVLEVNPAVFEKESPGLTQVTWHNVDACEVSSLEKVGLATFDVVVAATGDDEDNLVISLLSKQEFAVPRVVGRVNNPRNHWMFTSMWGVDTAVSTPHQLTALVEEVVSVGTLVKLLALGDGGANLVEVTLADNSPVVGKLISEIDLPTHSTIVAIIRDRDVVVPRGETRFIVGDEVVALVTNAAENEITALLVGP